MKTKRFFTGLIMAAALLFAASLPAMAAETSPQQSSEVTQNYNGFHQDPNGSDWYYYKNGKVDAGRTEVIKGKVNGKTAWWNVVKGKVTPGVTVAKNDNGWWYIDEQGKVDFDYTGFAENKNGTWYVEKGKVTFKKNGVLKDETGAVGKKGTWYYVVKSKVQTDYTGVANYKNENGWWYIKNGKVDFSANTVAKNKNGWWYVVGGKVQFGYTGVANYKNSNGLWYIKNGKVDFSYNGFASNKSGTWIVKNGKVKLYSTPKAQLSIAANGSITVKWKSVGAEKYRVYRKTDGGSWKKLADTTGTSYTDKTANTGVANYYTVRCVNAAGTAYTSEYISSYSGDEIVSYAERYLGLPYVWGGASLTDGCDCSGFVQQVYAHFGVYLPHYSHTQAKCGKAASSFKAGDIVYYGSGGASGGHVGISLGNDFMISAMNEYVGVGYSYVSPSYSGFALRRIF